MGRGHAEYIPVHRKHTSRQVTVTFLTLHSSLVLLFPVLKNGSMFKRNLYGPLPYYI